MPRKANEIVVEWLESKDICKRHRVNVKHIVGALQVIAVGCEVVVKLSSRRYRATVVNLLDWNPPKRKQKASKKTATREKQSVKVC